MSSLIPIWIIGGPFIGILMLSFSFSGSSSVAQSGSVYRPIGAA